MAWPLIAAAGIGSAIGSAAGGIANAFSSDDSGASVLKRQMRLLQAVRDPNFDWSTITPAQLQFIAQVDPTFYEAAVPDQVKLMAESPARSDQYAALGGLQRIGAQGLPLVDRLAAEGAIDTVGRGYRGIQEGLMRDLAQRGRASGGFGADAQLQASSNVSDLYGQMGQGLVREALQRRMDALAQSGQLAGQIRGADQTREAANAAMVNRFKEYISNARTAQRQYAADMTNANAMREAEGRQRVADTNRLNAQDVAEANLARRNQLEAALADFRLGRAGATTNLAGSLAEGARAQGASRAQAATNIGTGLGSVAGLLASLYGTKPTASSGLYEEYK